MSGFLKVYTIDIKSDGDDTTFSVDPRPIFINLDTVSGIYPASIFKVAVGVFEVREFWKSFLLTSKRSEELVGGRVNLPVFIAEDHKNIPCSREDGSIDFGNYETPIKITPLS